MAINDWERITFPILSGTSEVFGQTVRLELIDVPFERSPSRDELRMMDLERDDFFLWLPTEIEDAILAPQEGRFWSRKTDLCRVCRAPLAPEILPTPRTFELAVERFDVPRFQVRLEAPGVLCSACHTPNVRASQGIEDAINDAMLEILSALRI